MATLLLTGLGTLIGGSVGGAIGAVIGRQVDGRIFAPGKHAAPRLKDLSVTSSSYGVPIPRHFGRTRVAGSIIWAAELAERSQTTGGGKGKPKTKSYSYSTSFAVALSSRPINALGRIWADGKLLRGIAGDLKVGGQMRWYRGDGDEFPDPLLSGAIDETCPGFRDTAYVVFEDLQLEDFGNRIPALTFEVIADRFEQVALDQIVPDLGLGQATLELKDMSGFSDEGGSLLSNLELLEQGYPLLCINSRDGVELALLETARRNPQMLPPMIDFGSDEEGNDYSSSGYIHRAANERAAPRSLRYYDRSRDYQPGVQRSVGQAGTGREEVVELPAVFDAPAAVRLCNRITRRARWRTEQLDWAIAELDPSIQPGSIVKLPGKPGLWLVRNWEWHDRGIQLSLERVQAAADAVLSSDSGAIVPPTDQQQPASKLWVFELPWDGASSSSARMIFAAASAENAAWRGSALYLDRMGKLVDLDQAATRRAVAGHLVSALRPSSANFFEREAALEVELVGDDLEFATTTAAGIGDGENRLLVGEEILQFLDARQISSRIWRLSGLLRGRGGTEHLAAAGHAAGTSAILLDNSLVPLDPAEVPATPETRIAAIGLGDEAPVIANLAAGDATRRPLSPVHTSQRLTQDGGWNLGWVRRARGQWLWPDHVDTPLVEETQSFEVGVGSVESPSVSWTVASEGLDLPAAEVASLLASFPGAPVWVRQIGTYGRSPATLITDLI
ncbi:phage tail protein [Altererythrobacter arenosus]|uniref:Phage tail protein n=1 Tax=Altererythrobacter arenosus TaxID=3032592 RepID=A0ABY8FVS8_9SPHN|nr:phage tail protein [Altererythrobacter sp. CAU 1644]WFL78832.1 phage tail protein [Altererythrobacter sp. CAU 1644]